ncbi:uncharacterized protein [Dysidea avara]
MKICDEIMEPSRPYALRLSSKLLLGISRVFSKQMYFLLVDLRHVWESLKKKDNNSINLPPAKAKNRLEAVTLRDPFAHFNAWLLSSTADVLNMSISDFEFPSESEFQTISDSQTADLRDITLEEEDFPSCSTSIMDDDDNFGDACLQFDQHENADEQPATIGDLETMNVHCDPHNDSVLLYDEASGSLRQLEETPLVSSPTKFVLEELTPDHVQRPLRHRRLHNRRIRRDKERVLSDTSISDCLRTPECLLQSKEQLCSRAKPKELFDNNCFSVIHKGAFHLDEIWKRNASIPKDELFDYPFETIHDIEDGSESSVEILRGQYSISTASYEESREGGLSQLTPVNDQSSSLLSTQGNYEFEITSTQSRHKTPHQAVVPVGNLSPIMDEPEFDMDIGDISLPSLDDSDIESDTSVTSGHNVQLHDALREVVHTMEGKDDIHFSSLLPQPCLRKIAAKRFSQILALASKQVLCVHQDVPYGDIIISKGSEF